LPISRNLYLYCYLPVVPLKTPPSLEPGDVFNPIVGLSEAAGAVGPSGFAFNNISPEANH
jgi:hypothetical protein